MIVVYANPFVKERGKLDYYALWYANPFFHQGWNLFIPSPDSNYKLYATFNDNGLQKVDVFQEALLKHQSNRLKGYGPLVLAFVNSIHRFEKTCGEQKELNGPIQNNLDYDIIKKVVAGYLHYTRNVEDTDLKLVLVVENVRTARVRVYYN